MPFAEGPGPTSKPLFPNTARTAEIAKPPVHQADASSEIEYFCPIEYVAPAMDAQRRCW
jgi:hypothetical protein